MKEVWKPIKDYEGIYEISNTGKIRSLDRYVNSNNNNFRFVKSRLRKQFKRKDEYLYCCLYKNNKSKTTKVHRLVAETFIQNPHKKKTVNHKNGIKTDNRVENLEWSTHRENMEHAYKNKLINNNGESNGMSKLTEKDVRDMRKLSKFFKQSELAKIFNTSYKNVHLIIKNKRWKHI